MSTISNDDLIGIAKDLFRISTDSAQRGMRNSQKWAADLHYALCQIDGMHEKVIPYVDNTFNYMRNPEYSKYALAIGLFCNHEYDRAAYFTENCTSPLAMFLHFYALFCSGEKKRLDDIADMSETPDKAINCNLKLLRIKLQQGYLKKSLDGYCMYLYGLVLKKLSIGKLAVEVLCDAVHAEPLNWDAWLELSTLVPDREALLDLSLPNHWIKNFFLAHSYLELQMNDMALDIYSQLSEVGFSKSTYVTAQMAIAHHNMRELEHSIEKFQQLLKLDPYRLDNMDVYSNLLYVREMRVELSYLAHNATDIDKYRVETCCVTGNFYSLRKQHEKAVLYFQRALRLNPNYLCAWTLIGHEYMEMKNTSAAIQAYRQAIEVNRKDYRAWYGLGQTYEILKMTFYSLYYYKRAHFLQPNDSRMLVALGETYEKLDKLLEAKKCYWRAHAVGDVEGMALIKLAKIYSRLDEEDQAAAAYNDYVKEASSRFSNNRDELCHAYLFLARYYFKQANLERAFENAQQCMDFPETKENAKAILRQIAVRRTQQEDQLNDHSLYPVTIMSPTNFSFTP